MVCLTSAPRAPISIFLFYYKKLINNALNYVRKNINELRLCPTTNITLLHPHL